MNPLIYEYGYTNLSSNSTKFDKFSPLKDMVKNAVNGVVDGAPEDMDTLSEVAQEIDEIKGTKADKLDVYTKGEANAAISAAISAAVAGIVTNAPETLDTLGEIAKKLSDDDTVVNGIISQLSSKADAENVYDKATADTLFVDKSQYDELNQKYVTLLNVVYSTATGDAATALNPDYVEASLSSTNTSVVVTEGQLGDVTIPEAKKTYTVTAPMQDGANVNLTTPRAFNLVNTSTEPVNVTINVPETTASSAPTMSLSGDFDTIRVNNGSIGLKSGGAQLTANNVIVNNEQRKKATVSGVVFGEDATITSNVPSLGVANKNTSNDDNVPNLTINAENSTVTMNKGEWNTVNSNVGADTLIVTQNAHINTLNIVKGNVVVNDREVSNRIGNVINETDYTVSLNTHTVVDGAELGSALTGNPGVVLVGADITRSRITWGIFGSGNYLLDLKGHVVTISDATFGIMSRNTVNLKIVDTVGGGKFINDKAYGLWAGDNSVITIDVPESTEIIGVTHTLYCEGSGHPTINVLGGTYKMIVSPDSTDVYDVNGLYKFMLNHYDATYRREGNCFNITGGKFYNFNPMASYGEPGGPVNLLPVGYTVNETVEDGVRVFSVVPQ